MAFLNAVLAITDPGDEVIITAPYYFNHEMAITIAGARPVVVPTDGHYQLRLDALEAAITPRSRAIVTISPNNPTGAVFPEADLRAAQRALSGGTTSIISPTKRTSTSPGTGRLTSRRLRSPGARTTRSVSTRYPRAMVSPVGGSATWSCRRPCRADSQDSGHELDLSAGVSQWAALGALEAGRDVLPRPTARHG